MEKLIEHYKALFGELNNKAEVARAIAKEHPTLSRAEAITLFTQALAMNKQGASTYYYNVFKSNTAATNKPANKELSSMNFPFADKESFLAIPAVASLTSALRRLIVGERFDHAYKHWQCSSLPDAKINYLWHGDYASNKQQLDEMAQGIKAACNNNDESTALYWSIKILDWGKVYKECVSYVLRHYEAGRLCSVLRDGCAILDGKTYDLSRFDQHDLRMDSGLTKIFSMAATKSIIFDSRVTAALFLVAVEYLSPEEVSELENLYAIAGGKSSSRYKPAKRKKVGDRVAKLELKPFLNKQQFPLQAHLNLLANWLLQEAIERAQHDADLLEAWQVDDKTELLRAVEAALFMVGADIDRTLG